MNFLIMIKIKVADDDRIIKTKDGCIAISDELDKKLDLATAKAMTTINTIDTNFISEEGDWYIDE